MHPTPRDVLHAIVGSVPLALAGCLLDGSGGQFKSELYPSPPSTPQNDLGQLTLGTTRFALDLHAQLVDETPGDNLLPSPHSIPVSIAMTVGETRSQIRETFQYTLDDEELNRTFHELDVSLSNRETAENYSPPTVTESDDESAAGTIVSQALIG